MRTQIIDWKLSKRQGAGVSSEIETLEFAINVAREKLRIAEQVAAAQIERENRKKMLERAAALRKRAAQLDEDVARVVGGYNLFLREATAVGLVRLHANLVQVVGRYLDIFNKRALRSNA